jgi:response regulator RpfG family c-di-GMP phosphodiesterase
MALDPADRYPTPSSVIEALNEFLDGWKRTTVPTALTERNGALRAAPLAAPDEPPAGSRGRRVLIASTHVNRRGAYRAALDELAVVCVDVARSDEACELLKRFRADVVVVDDDDDAEGWDGTALCRRLRGEALIPHLKIVLVSKDGPAAPAPEVDAAVCDARTAGSAVDACLAAQVRLLLRVKEVEERGDRLHGCLLTTNAQLEQALQQRDQTAKQSQDVLIYAMAKVAELRGQETGAHLLRMQRYVRILAEEAKRLPAFAPIIDDAWVRMLERCVLLHDIGKVAIPDHILMKPGKLDDSERSIMESHTVLGADILEAVVRQQGACLAFLQMAIDVVRHHHEKYDGAGYPDALVGDAIPLAARLVALADVYDAMRSKLVYKPGLSHAAVRRLLLNPTQTHFDPAVMQAFRQCDGAFEQTFAQTPD